MSKMKFIFQPAECQALISKLRSCSHAELLEELKQIDAWTFGKCELFHWIDVLDLSDSILEEAATRSTDNPWELACDLPQNSEVTIQLDLIVNSLYVFWFLRDLRFYSLFHFLKLVLIPFFSPGKRVTTMGSSLHHAVDRALIFQAFIQQYGTSGNLVVQL